MHIAVVSAVWHPVYLSACPSFLTHLFVFAFLPAWLPPASHSTLLCHSAHYLYGMLIDPIIHRVVDTIATVWPHTLNSLNDAYRLEIEWIPLSACLLYIKWPFMLEPIVLMNNKCLGLITFLFNVDHNNSCLNKVRVPRHTTEMSYNKLIYITTHSA